MNFCRIQCFGQRRVWPTLCVRSTSGFTKIYVSRSHVIRRNRTRRHKTTVSPSVNDVDHPSGDGDHQGRHLDHPSRDVDHPSSVTDEDGNEKCLVEADDDDDDGDAFGSSETKKKKKST